MAEELEADQEPFPSTFHAKQSQVFFSKQGRSPRWAPHLNDLEASGASDLDEATMARSEHVVSQRQRVLILVLEDIYDASNIGADCRPSELQHLRGANCPHNICRVRPYPAPKELVLGQPLGAHPDVPEHLCRVLAIKCI
jgi:hypothetical protein